MGQDASCREKLRIWQIAAAIRLLSRRTKHPGSVSRSTQTSPQRLHKPLLGRGAVFFRYSGSMEQKFIRWLEENFAVVAASADDSQVVLGIGDDGAVLSGSVDEHQVVVSDAIVDKVHFDSSVHDLARVGHKALAVNLSDIAAMGALPESALVSLVLPQSFTFEQTKQLFSGIATTAQKYGCAIVGGDTCSHDGALMVSVTATGRIPTGAKAPHGWRMDRAKDGDLIVVTGALGGSIVSKHLDFEPRIDIARSIQKRVAIHAATDISDSLTIDLAHVLRKSGLGAVLDVAKIPIAEDAKGDLNRALEDGEDFELLLFLSRQEFDTLTSDSSFAHPLYPIGKANNNEPGTIVDGETGAAIEAAGYEHG